jgi:LPS O-antigen subunit length determinant protein (WzzB/FepE family)
VLDKQLEALDDQEIDAYLKRQAEAAKELQSAFEALIPPEVPTRQEQFATLTEQVTQAMRDGTITFDDYRAKLEQIKEAQEETFNVEDVASFFSGVQSYANDLYGNLQQVSDFFTEQANSKVEEAIAARKRLGKDATEEERRQAKERVEDAKEAARKAFEVNKALQIAQVVVNTAAAVAQALASAPPPFNALAAAGAAAAGAVQLATVQSTEPKFHKGGLIGQPDEQTAIVRRGEAVLNPMGRSLLGDDTIRAANAGMGSGSGGHAVQIVYKHKSFDYFVRDHLRTNATLPRALNAGRRLGQRG